MQTIESKYPVLVLSFHNCEIHCCHLDGYKANSVLLLERLQKIEAHFVSPSSRRVWFNVDDSDMTDEVIQRIAQSIARIQSKVVKIAFVGMGGKQRAFDRSFTVALSGASLPRAYFRDAEVAKEWLL